MIEGKLPNFFSFKSSNDLIRIGKDNDGGYLVSKKDLEIADVLLSLGISNDWTFEEDFIRLNNVNLYAYDASIDEKVFLKIFLKSLVVLNKPLLIFKNFKTIYLYLRFFSKKKVSHIKKFVGYDSLNLENNISMDKVIERINDSKKNIFLKIDIEGSEYRILETLLLNQSKICGLVIEFHDIDLHLDKIERFIKNFSLNLVHIHANNAGGIKSENSLPLIIEITFSKYSSTFTEKSLPHELDSPNNSKNKEIQLIIE
tara:strand:+ start:669 stop:1439 length:771 start_codon:yes stop_codon:yes gene_type:complete